MSDADPDTFLTVTEVANDLRVDPRTVYRMIDRGDLVALRTGRRWRIRRSEIDRAAAGPDTAPEPPIARATPATDALLDALVTARVDAATARARVRHLGHLTRSPVSALLGYVSMMDRVEGAERDELVGRIGGVARRIADQLDELVSPSGEQADPVELQLRSLVDERRHLLDVPATIVVGGPTSVAVVADPIWMRVLIDGLIGAVWHSAVGRATITVRDVGEGAEPLVELSTAIPEPDDDPTGAVSLELAVADRAVARLGGRGRRRSVDGGIELRYEVPPAPIA